MKIASQIKQTHFDNPLLLQIIFHYRSFTMSGLKKFYRPKEVCELLGIAKSTFYLYVSQGKLKTTKLSERVAVVTEDELKRFLGGAV